MSPDERYTSDGVGEPGVKPGRVLVIAPTPFFGDRGCHVRIYEEVRAIAARGIESSVVTYASGRDLPDVRTARARAIPGIGEAPLGFSAGRPALDLAVLFAANREVARFRPDLLHTHLHEGIAIGVVLQVWHRLPLVADLQGSLTSEMVDQGALANDGLPAGVMRRIERWLVRRPARILTSSGQGVPLLTTQGVEERRVTPLPDGVDLAAFCPQPRDAALVEKLGLSQKRVVVFLGVLTDYQGVDVLLDVAERLSRSDLDAHLLVLGYPNEERYRAEAKARGLDSMMTFPGRVPYAEAARWLCLGDVAVSPKRSMTEANGKLLNYMGCGLPVVASDTPVNRELLGESGLFAPVGDAEAFATQIAVLLADPARAGQVGAALRQRAQTMFAWPVLAARLESVYREAMAER